LDFHFVVIVVIEAGVVYQFVINWWQNPATAPSLSVSLDFHDAILTFTLKLVAPQDRFERPTSSLTVKRSTC
jgi:hypothetical protein